MDFQKKDWQFRDIISEDELNRMEDGIEEGITKAEQAQGTADNAQNAIDNHIAATTGVHGATSAATPNTIVQRDSSGRFKAAVPSDPDDVARKAEVDERAPLSGAVFTGPVEYSSNPRESSDLNNEINPGWVVFTSSTANRPDVSGFPSSGVVRIERRTSNRVAQTAYGLTGNNDANIVVRVLGDSGWSPWYKIWNESNDGAGSGLDADLLDGLDSSAFSLKSDYVRQPGYAVAAGSANTYSVTLSPSPTAYVDGMAVAVKINVNNTGASTLNVNGLGAKAIKKPNGNDVSAGNLKAGSVYTFRYNANTGNFILQGEGGSGNAQPADVLSGKTFTNDDGEQVGTMPNRAGTTIDNGAVNITKAETSGSSGILTIKSNTTGFVNTTTNYQQSITNLIAPNIKAGVKVGNPNVSGAYLEGTFTADATAQANQILSGQTAYVNGNKVTGTMPDRSTGDYATDDMRRSGSTLRLSVPGGAFYGNGSFITVTDPNWIPENIREGVSLFGLVGTLMPGYIASGTSPQSTMTDGSGSGYTDGIKVSGLSFKPKLVLVFSNLASVSSSGPNMRTDFMIAWDEGFLTGLTDYKGQMGIQAGEARYGNESLGNWYMGGRQPTGDFDPSVFGLVFGGFRLVTGIRAYSNNYFWVALG